ncbi:hypothetical protein AtDm6_1826 [Acetobacter tropicalis]|uniref:Uncharacterized protein n=1 Tax=Acetobacter tropicalis TaxID=104102 RepID=A0A094YNK7_9PROT|nr:hypothetical protein AtDm6_1826 [Acetobacter tropicalis]
MFVKMPQISLRTRPAAGWADCVCGVFLPQEEVLRLKMA